MTALAHSYVHHIQDKPYLTIDENFQHCFDITRKTPPFYNTVYKVCICYKTVYYGFGILYSLFSKKTKYLKNILVLLEIDYANYWKGNIIRFKG